MFLQINQKFSCQIDVFLLKFELYKIFEYITKNYIRSRYFETITDGPDHCQEMKEPRDKYTFIFCLSEREVK